MITPNDGGPAFRFACRPSRVRSDGVRSFRIGATCGWWPCLHGPFVQFYVGFWVWDFWYGTPSYETTPADARANRKADNSAREGSP